MPIVDIQTRFRELGRIRMGILEKPEHGKPRPKKIARYRLTSKWRHLLDDAARIYGGTPRPWEHPQEGPQFELFVEADALNVLVPPGEVLSQWYELWSGGGCQRRCDGLRQALVDKACQCPADPAERTRLAAENPPKACRVTTRLAVMLPDVADLGVWRLESHGYYAAVELAGAAGLCELATRRGIMIPATLRLEARSVSRPGEPRKRFAVPALSFRGNLGDTLDALGMTRGDLPVVPALESRPAIDAGGRPELPPAPVGFGETAPLEEAAIPPAGLDEPDAFVPPEPERDPDEERASLSWAQLAAMRAGEAGLNDDQRHGLYQALTDGRTATGAELTGLERNVAMALIVKLARGEVALARAENVWAVIDRDVGLIHSSAELIADLELELVAPAQHAGKRWTYLAEGSAGQKAPSAPPPEPSTPPAAPAPSPSPAPATAVSEPPSAPGDGPEDLASADSWRRFMRRRTPPLRVSDVIKVAIELCPAGTPPPGNIDGLVALPELAAAVANRFGGTP